MNKSDPLRPFPERFREHVLSLLGFFLPLALLAEPQELSESVREIAAAKGAALGVTLHKADDLEVAFFPQELVPLSFLNDTPITKPRFWFPQAEMDQPKQVLNPGLKSFQELFPQALAYAYAKQVMEPDEFEAQNYFLQVVALKDDTSQWLLFNFIDKRFFVPAQYYRFEIFTGDPASNLRIVLPQPAHGSYAKLP